MREGIQHTSGRSNGEASLADSPCTGEGERPTVWISQALSNLGDFNLPSKERRGLRRDMVNAYGEHGCVHTGSLPHASDPFRDVAMCQPPPATVALGG